MPVINWIIRFLSLGLLLLFQVLVLNDLNINGYIHPYIYPMFLIMIPFDTPRWVYLPLAFGVGLLVDIFTNTPGMHAFACVLIVYLRPWILKLMTPVTGYENMENPSIAELGFVWFSLFTFIMILIHHTAYYLLNTFAFGHFEYAMIKTLASTIISTLLCILLAFLFTPRKIKR